MEKTISDQINYMRVNYPIDMNTLALNYYTVQEILEITGASTTSRFSKPLLTILEMIGVERCQRWNYIIDYRKHFQVTVKLTDNSIQRVKALCEENGLKLKMHKEL